MKLIHLKKRKKILRNKKKMRNPIYLKIYLLKWAGLICFQSGLSNWVSNVSWKKRQRF